MIHTLTIEPYVTAPHRLFGAATRLMDRAVPLVERIELPPAVSPGGTIEVEPDAADRLPPSRTGLRMLRHRLRPDRSPPPVDGPVVDLRAHSPQNWSHALMIHLPLAMAAADVLGRDPTVILPFNTPRYIHTAFALCGFGTIATDHGIAGAVCRVEASDLDMLKQATAPTMRARALRLHASDAPGVALPTRFFLARRGARSIVNQAEIEAILHPLGYETLYPEQLSPLDQFRLFDRAREIVAVHGAGLSPLCYRRPDAGPLSLVEISPAAHMTNHFRLVVDQAGARYAAVRGRITAEDAAHAYDAQMYEGGSLKPFSVDPATVELAMAEVGIDPR